MSGNLGSFTTFNSSGKLGQLENALAAVGQGKTSIGIRTKEGAVVVTDRILPTKRIVATSADKVLKICNSIGITYSGIRPDFRQIARFCRKKACAYNLKNGEDIPVKQLAQLVGEEMQRATQRGGMRPYGVSVLIIGFDHRGSQLWMVDPSGTYFSWKGTAVGKKNVKRENVC